MLGFCLVAFAFISLPKLLKGPALSCTWNPYRLLIVPTKRTNTKGCVSISR